MSARHNGGAAFPIPGGPKDGYGNPTNPPQYGMTLRDWFAGQAMSSMAGTIQTADPESVQRAAKRLGYSGPIEGFVALESYRLADAMIAERSK